MTVMISGPITTANQNVTRRNIINQCLATASGNYFFIEQLNHQLKSVVPKQLFFKLNCLFFK